MEPVTVATAAANSPPSPSSSFPSAANRVFPLRMLVNSDHVGAIIGRSGTTIRTITQQTKARIDVHRDETPDQKEKLITITGPPEGCSEACYQILKICRDEQNAPIYREEISGLIQEVYPNPNVDTLRILAPGSLIGRLIGKAGASIKKIMEQTSTKISVNNMIETTGEHIITVTGNIEQIRRAEKLISSKLRTAFMSDMNNSLQAMNHQPYLFNNLPLPYLVPNLYAPHRNSLITRSVPLNHSHHQGQMPAPMYQNSPGYLPLYTGIPASQSSPSGLVGFNPMVSRSMQERETVYMYIPSTMVGVIIGRSGAAIKEMISTSGATIKVDTTPIHSKASTSTTTTTATTPPSSDAVESTSDENTRQPNQNISAENHEPSNSKGSEAEKEVSNKLEDLHISSTNRHNNTSDTKQNNTNMFDFSTLRKVTVIGYPASQYSAQYLIYRKVSIENARNDTKLIVEIHVPTQLIGKLIGKGGASVKSLQKQTRTTIRLPDEKPAQKQGSPDNNNDGPIDPADSNSKTVVQIIGEFEGSQVAQRNIRNMIRSGNNKVFYQ